MQHDHIRSACKIARQHKLKILILTPCSVQQQVVANKMDEHLT